MTKIKNDIEHDMSLGDKSSPDRTPNNLADCLAYIARFHGLSATAQELDDKLALSSCGVPPILLKQAAQKLGLKSQVEAISLDSIPALTLPAILSLEDGSYIILLEAVSGERYRIAEPAKGHMSRTISRANLLKIYNGYCVFVTPDHGLHLEMTREVTRADERTGGWFWGAVKAFWPSYMQVAVAAILVNILALASPLFVMNVYDRVIPNLAITTLWSLTFGVGIAIVFDLVLRILRSWIVDRTGRRIDMAIAGQLFDKLVSLRLQARPTSSGILANQIREFDSIRDVLTSNAVVAVLDSAFIGIFLFVMWLLVGPLTLVVGLAVPAVLLFTLMCQIPLNRATRQAQSDSARRHGLLVSTASSLEDVKSVGASSWLRRQWDRSVAASSKSSSAIRFWNHLSVTGMTTTQQIVSVIVITWGVFLVLDGQVTVGALIATNILSGRVLAPLSNVAQTLSRIAQARSALSSLNNFMAQPEDNITPQQGLVATGEGHVIEADDLGLTYPTAEVPSLNSIKLAIRPGERIAVIGQIGSGKTTLGRCLSGLIDLTEGRVLIDHMNISQFGAASIRNAITYCGQDPDLFEGTLRDNIIAGAPFASDDMIAESLRISGVEQFASEHPSGLAMPIQERGRNLSGGQRQAIALARILIRKPSILFLDEPTASMDASNERRLLSELQSSLKDHQTLIVATHKEAILALVDRVIVLDKGRVVMDGPKESVLADLQALRNARRKAAMDA